MRIYSAAIRHWFAEHRLVSFAPESPKQMSVRDGPSRRGEGQASNSLEQVEELDAKVASRRQSLQRKEAGDRAAESQQESNILGNINSQPEDADKQKDIEEVRQEIFREGRALLTDEYGPPDVKYGHWTVGSGSIFRSNPQFCFMHGLWMVQLSRNEDWSLPTSFIPSGAFVSDQMKKIVLKLEELNQRVSVKRSPYNGQSRVRYSDGPIAVTGYLMEVRGDRAEFWFPSYGYFCAEIDPKDCRRELSGDDAHCLGTGTLPNKSNRCVLSLKPGQREATIGVWPDKKAVLWGVYDLTKKDRENTPPHYIIKLIADDGRGNN